MSPAPAGRKHAARPAVVASRAGAAEEPPARQFATVTSPVPRSTMYVAPCMV